MIIADYNNSFPIMFPILPLLLAVGTSLSHFVATVLTLSSVKWAWNIMSFSQLTPNAYLDSST